MIEHTPSLIEQMGLGSIVDILAVDALIGAFIGASIFTAKTRNVTCLSKVMGLLLSALCGYLFAIEMKDFVNEVVGRFFHFQFKQLEVLACIMAIISVPFLNKLVDWANNFNLSKLIDKQLNKIVKRLSDKKNHDDDFSA